MAEIVEGKKPYDALTDAEDLTAGTDVTAEGDFSLEEILAEYGGSRRQQILEEVEEKTAPVEPAESAPLAGGAETADLPFVPEEPEEDTLLAGT